MIVTVKQGKLSGTENVSLLSKKPYYSFVGIPYAKPPVGNLRFQVPEPSEKWEGVLNATKEGSMCIQRDSFVTNQFFGEEDCLTINVHTPEPPSEIQTPKAVLVFIHGGAFSVGSSSSFLYSPDYLINHDIIFVSFNYRVHILGFLNLGLPDCPGNVGLKDQILALEWIKENIKSFGGDPNNITIFGESAGAASVHYHIISPLSRNKELFNRCIMESGNSLNVFSLTDHPIETAFKMGKLVGYNGSDKKELLEVLKKIPAKELAEYVEKLQVELKKEYPARCLNFPFIPSVEFIKDGAFIPEHPREMLKKAKPISFISGLNDQEGLISFKADPIELQIEQFNRNFNPFVEHNLGYESAVAAEVAAKIKKFYFGDVPFSLDSVPHFTNLYSDFIFSKEFYESIDFAVKSVPAYLYLFNYDGNFNFYKRIFAGNLPTKIDGACHADEMGYLFVAKLFPPEDFAEQDVKVINNMCTLWTNFAKTGNPNGDSNNAKWAPTTEQKPVYLEINQDLKLKDGRIFADRIAFWEKLNAQHKISK